MTVDIPKLVSSDEVVDGSYSVDSAGSFLHIYGECTSENAERLHRTEICHKALSIYQVAVAAVDWRAWCSEKKNHISNVLCQRKLTKINMHM